MLNQEAKTLNPTQAELGGEASPPSAASASAADLAQNAAKRCKTPGNGGTMLEKNTPKRTKKTDSNKTRKRLSKWPPGTQKLAPRVPRGYILSSAGEPEAQKTSKTRTKITDFKTPQEGDFKPRAAPFAAPERPNGAPERNKGRQGLKMESL